VSECAVGVGHPVRILALLDGGAAVLGGIEQLVREPHGHALLGTAACGVDGPAHRERLAPRRAYLDGHLVGGAADAPRLHLDGRLDVFERLAEELEAEVARYKKLLVDAGGSDWEKLHEWATRERELSSELEKVLKAWLSLSEELGEERSAEEAAP
jgi:hypothetical protein